MQLAPSIHRIGTNSIVNAYLIEEGGEVTIIDAGMPGYHGDIELAAMVRTVADVRALVLTHGHTDHSGFVERLRREKHVAVRVHEADAALARGEVPKPAKGGGPVRLRRLLGFLWFSARHGALRTPKVTEVATYGDDATLDVPGSPKVILVPGHTLGRAALHVPRLDALFVGDAIDHVVAALWTSEVLHSLRLRTETFRSACPDTPDSFAAWWVGSAPAPGTRTSLVVFDPLPGQCSSRRRWIGLDDVRSAEPHYRGYVHALEALKAGGLA